MDDLAAVRLFLLVAEEASFAAAARRAGVSPAVATRRIAALEQALSTRLFARSTRHVSLTQEGWLFRQHAEQVVVAADAAVEAMQTRNARPEGRVRVLCHAGIGRHLIVPALAEFRTRCPAVTVSVQVNEDRTLSLLDSGCDVAVSIGQLSDSSLVQRRLVETDSQLYASPDYLARRGTPRDPDELADHDCMTFNAASGSATWRFSRDERSWEVAIRAALAVNDADSLMCAARAGLGVILIADWMAAEDVRRGALVPILQDYQVEPRGTPITALYPSRMYVPLKVRVLVDYLAEVCERRFSAS